MMYKPSGVVRTLKGKAMKSSIRMSATGTTIDGMNANHVDKASIAAAIKTKLGLKA